MPGRFLLDTNVVIGLLAGDAAIVRAMGEADEVMIPSVVAGELWYGAFMSGRREANLDQVTAFLRDRILLACTGETAQRYGRIKSDLRSAGTPIPENDIWIAAIAEEHGLVIATRDEHFQAVGSVAIATW